MTYWIYKCNAKGQSHQVSSGDWNTVFEQPGASRWGNIRFLPDLAKLSVNDLVLAHQTDRNELVGLVRVKQFNKEGQNEYVILQPIREIRAKVRPLKEQNPRIAAIPALKPGPIRTIYNISDADAKLLLREAGCNRPSYYIVNTNNQAPFLNAHEYMLREKRAAAFYDPWKHEIDRIDRGDIVFLYESGVGIVAVGRASGRIETKPCGKGERYEKDGEHSMKLLDFKLVDPPISAKAISAISDYATGTRVILRPTVVRLRPMTGVRLHKISDVTK